MNALKMAQREQAQNILIAEAIKFYNFDTLHICKKAQRRERLLMTALAFNLDTQEAQRLADETQERNRDQKGGNA